MRIAWWEPLVRVGSYERCGRGTQEPTRHSQVWDRSHRYSLSMSYTWLPPQIP